jgi:hypothetical protein
MEEREKRIAMNEARFRVANEGISHLRTELETDELPFACECGRAGCEERMELTASEYEAVRSDSVQFAVKPGHELEDVEDVVERHSGYLVIRKHPGETAELVRERDPRG